MPQFQDEGALVYVHHNRSVYGGKPGPHMQLMFWIREMPTPRWLHAISTRHVNAIWGYDGTAWGSNGGWSNSNGLLAAEYATQAVSRIKISMNGHIHDFELKSEFAGRFTLKELVTGPTNIAYLQPKGWSSSTVIRPFGMEDNSNIENYICHELSFNYIHETNEHTGDVSHARIGFSQSQEFPCSHPGTAQGIGLTDGVHGTQLASGLVQWSSLPELYHQAEVYII